MTLSLFTLGCQWSKWTWTLWESSPLTTGSGRISNIVFSQKIDGNGTLFTTDHLRQQIPSFSFFYTNRQNSNRKYEQWECTFQPKSRLFGLKGRFFSWKAFSASILSIRILVKIWKCLVLNFKTWSVGSFLCFPNKISF
jgi:hypothetical protein